MSLPSSYKAVVVESAGAPLTLKDIPLGAVAAGQVLVKVIACGICHTDAIVQAGYLGNAFPRVPGHEIVGDVVKVGDGVTAFHPGDRVGGSWHGDIANHITDVGVGRHRATDHRRRNSPASPPRLTASTLLPQPESLNTVFSCNRLNPEESRIISILIDNSRLSHHLKTADMAQKPWRDWAYLAIISTQLFGMLALDFVPFYPKSLYAAPSAPLHFLVSLRSIYLATSGDPFFAAAGHAPWFQAFLYVEALAQFPLAAYLVSRLASRKPTSGPAELAGLAFGCLTAMGSVACCAELWAMGPDVVKDEHKAKLLYGTYLPFVVIPAMMAIDMYLRLLPRVRVGTVKPKRQ